MKLPSFLSSRPLPKIRWSDLRPANLRVLAAQSATRAWTGLRDRCRVRFTDLLAELWQAITARWIRSLFTALFAGTVAVAGLKLLPVVYGRYALLHAAGLAARQSLLKGEDRVVLELRVKAYDLGLTEGALASDVFRLEPTTLEDGPACVVTYDFIHRVDFFGLYRLPMRCRGRVVRLQVTPVPNALEGEETRSGPAVQQ
jgi:hypothetical protein